MSVLNSFRALKNPFRGHKTARGHRLANLVQYASVCGMEVSTTPQQINVTMQGMYF
jgi:hypothetical protein